MADNTITIKTGDTWPPITIALTESCKETSTGAYEEETGSDIWIRRVNLFTNPPDSISITIKPASGPAIIGAMINAEVVDGSDANDLAIGNVPGNRGEVRYLLAAGDSDDPAVCKGEVKVTWDAGSTPPAVERFPNDPANNYSVVFAADLD
jgi:hypothetical protein